MRICILNDNFYRGSGITLAIKRLLKAPAFKDVEVYLAGCERLAGAKSLHEDASLTNAERYRYFNLMSGVRGLLPAVYDFTRWAKAMHFDVIHVHHRRLAVYAHLLRSVTHVPVLFTGHLTFGEALWFKEFAPRVMTGVSPSVTEYLRRCTRAVDVTTIYNPVDFPLEQADRAVFAKRRVIAVGRLEKVKGLDTLLEAWGRLQRKGFRAHLDIFGEGSLHEALAAQIVREELSSSVTLAGFASNIAERFTAYSFNVLVSEREGFPNSVVEAAACGLPTLLTSVDGSRDALPPGLRLVNGLQFGDVDGLCAALEQWLDHPELLYADGQLFHDYLKMRCAPEVVGSEYLKVYSSMQHW